MVYRFANRPLAIAQMARLGRLTPLLLWTFLLFDSWMLMARCFAAMRS